ncbi:UNVERIFIED_CONTAM: hypothetical protein Scaly_0068100 [Sesamum calycinum]|uniref:Uncharacterized protein n=1 Tax=Sesamum calycinum TaxID=2727403 RepID=A0AAW2SUW0_9LAMI
MPVTQKERASPSLPPLGDGVALDEWTTGHRRCPSVEGDAWATGVALAPMSDGVTLDRWDGAPNDTEPSSYYGGAPYDYVFRLANRFHDVVHVVEQLLCNGFTQSQLTSVVDLCPATTPCPLDYYGTKKLIRDLSLPIENIDACNNGCILYWKDDIDLDCSKFRGEARYKLTRERNPNHKKTLYAILTPRLQRFYASATAEQITWHANHHTEEESMCHSSYVESWSHFDRAYPDFAAEPVRLGLCTDGFTPHGQIVRIHIGSLYSTPPGSCRGKGGGSYAPTDGQKQTGHGYFREQ